MFDNRHARDVLDQVRQERVGVQTLIELRPNGQQQTVLFIANGTVQRHLNRPREIQIQDSNSGDLFHRALKC